MVYQSLPGVLDPGDVREVALIDSPTAGEFEVRLTTLSDSILSSLFCNVLSSGTLTVQIFTYGREENERKLIVEFPILSAPTAELLLEKAAISMDNVLCRLVWTGPCKANLRIKAISTGEASVRIASPNAGKVSQTNITTSPSLIVPLALADRAGIIVKNNSLTATVYLGYTLLEATTGNGFPLGPTESLGIDLSSGAALYGVASAGTIDVRVMESST